MELSLSNPGPLQPPKCEITHLCCFRPVCGHVLQEQQGPPTAAQTQHSCILEGRSMLSLRTSDPATACHPHRLPCGGEVTGPGG